MGTNKSNIKTNRTDIVASVARGIAGACPFVGSLIAEAVNNLIPNQKLDRVINFIKSLDQRVSNVESEGSNLKSNLEDENGLDLLEDGIVQASRTLTEERRSRLANLLAKSLSQKQLKYEESKKLLNLFRELTDPELLWLVYYSKAPTFGSEYHQELMNKHPEILQPASRSTGVAQEEINRGALQDSYKNTLVRLGLLDKKSRNYDLTSLGRLLIRYIESEPNESSLPE